MRDFIRRYPESPYMAQAEGHLDALIVAEQERRSWTSRRGRSPAPEVEADAAAAWNSVKNSSNPAEVQALIERYPESRWR